MSGKSRQHPACRSLETALCGPGRSILSAFSSSPPRQNQYRYDSGMLAASMASTWRLRQQRAMKSSIPMNYPWGSARTCHVAPVHFQPPIAGPVLSPHVCAPLPSHVGPQQQDQSACSQESCHPGGPQWGQCVPGMRPPSTFGRILRPVRVLSTCMCRTRSCCCR
jgi:hypothetical protein